MKRGIRFYQSIQAKLILIYVLLILVAMQLIGAYFFLTMERYFKNDFIDSRTKQAQLLAETAEQYLSQKGQANSQDAGKTADELNELVNLFGISKAEIQIIDSGGIVLSTSVTDRQSIVGQRNIQTEVSRALQGIRDNQRLFTDFDGIKKMAIAMPIGSGVKIYGAVYIIASMEDVYGTLSLINRIFLSGTLIAMALTAVLGVILSSTITGPVKQITKQATAVAEGQFDQSVPVRGNDEIGQLGDTFNYMTLRLKEALSMNEAEREKLASILTNMNDGLIASDEHGSVILINRRAKQLLKLQETDVLGKTIDEVLSLTNSEPLDEGEKASDALHEAQPALLTLRHDIEDEPVYLRMTRTSIQSHHQDGAAGTIVVLQDVTEQEKLEQSRREFVANVSHELRTPLTTIKSYLEALEDGALEDRQLAGRFVGVARNETERMIRLVTDLLQLSRLDSKRAAMNKQLVDIREMLEEVADRFSFQFEQKHITFDVKADETLQQVLLDRDRIDQVLDNLVSNAVKYTPDGGHVQIRSEVSEESGMLAVSVRDNGMGIPKKDLHRIFERFYRVDKARARNMGGTGLGLSIAREIVRAHGGTIQLESELGAGTKVTFTLPYMQGGTIA